MSDDTEDAFRGEKAIKQISVQIRAMADFLTAHRPEVKSIVIYRADRKLLQRWPQAAELAGFKFDDGEPFWGKFQLRIDKGVKE